MQPLTVWASASQLALHLLRQLQGMPCMASAMSLAVQHQESEV